MAIEVDEVTTATSPMGGIDLPKCPQCVCGNVCKFRERYESLADAITALVSSDFIKDTPPGSISIKCNEFRANNYIRPDGVLLKQYNDSGSLAKTLSSNEGFHAADESHNQEKTDSVEDEETRRRKKNDVALESLDYLTKQLDGENVKSEHVSISTAEKNDRPINLYGRTIDYKEALDLVNRGILLDRSPDPDHPVFVIKS